MLGSHDFGSRDSNNVVMAGPWLQREGHVADTAVAIDRLIAKIERLERREEDLQKQVADLISLSHQAGRFQALAESLRNSRDYKVDETARQVRDLRSRMEAIEGPRAEFSGRTFKSLVAMDQKLVELAGPKADPEDAASLRRWLFSGVFMTALVAAFLTSLVVPLV